MLKESELFIRALEIIQEEIENEDNPQKQYQLILEKDRIQQRIDEYIKINEQLIENYDKMIDNNNKIIENHRKLIDLWK